MHDILIRNAKVIDGTGKPAFSADVAVEEGRIAEVGNLKQSQGKHVIDAGGCAVAPGFIDMHSHADFSLPIQPTADSLLYQGITTAVVGQCGLSPAPLIDETREELMKHIQEGMKTEESAVTIYSRHLSAIVSKSGLPELTISKIKRTLQILIQANKEHKDQLNALLKRIQGESIDVY